MVKSIWTKLSAWAVFLLALTPLTAFSHAALEFNADNRQERLEVPGKNCIALLDDDSNYTLSVVDDHTFVISTKAASERSALLLIDCAGVIYPYPLSFSNRSKYEYEEKRYKEGVTRPNSYVGYSHSVFKSVPATNTFEVFDQSYNPLGVGVSRTYLDPGNERMRLDSVDAFHYWDDYSLSYGTTTGRLWSGEEHAFRTYVGGFGAFAGAQQVYQEHGAKEESYVLSTPAPLLTRFLYHKALDGAMDRRAQRNLFGNVGLLASNTLLELERYNFAAIDEDYTQGNITEDLNYNGLPWVRPGAEFGGFLRKGAATPLLNLTKLKSEFRYETAYFEIKYGLVPHDLATVGRYRFHRGQEVSIMVNQSYAPFSWIKRQKWISNEATPGVINPWDAQEMRSAALLHLEYTDGAYTLTADHDIPIHRGTGEERLFGRLGIQVDQPKLVALASVGFTYGRPSGIAEVLLEIRYYPDANIKALVQKSYTYRVSGRVLSIFGDKPLADMPVSLMRDDKEIAKASTLHDGSFVFHDVRSGGYRLVAQKTGCVKTVDIDVAGENREVAAQLVMDDYAKIRVKFLLAPLDKPAFSPANVAIDLQNFMPELGEGIVSFKDAGYSENLIWIPRQGKVALKVTPELLPFGFRFLDIRGAIQDTDREGEGIVEILLQKKT